MNDAWTEPETPYRPPKHDPWIAFGGMMIVTVASILFGVGTWIIRSGQTANAVETAAQVTKQLHLAQENAVQDLENSNEGKFDLANQLNALQSRFGELEATATSTAGELRTVQSELIAKTRERDQYQQIVERDRMNDLDPNGLPRATLREAFGDLDDIVALITFADKDSASGISRGALREQLKQQGRDKCGFVFVENGSSALVLNVVVLVSENDRTSIGITLELKRTWKVPGHVKSHTVSLWEHFIVGACHVDRAPVYAEELMDDLLDDLAKELAPPAP